MKLTGKCKQDFEKWYLKDIDIDECDVFNNDTMLSIFYTERESMQYGVYEDFFNSVRIILDIQPILEFNDSSYIKVGYYLVHVKHLNLVAEYNYTDCKTRPEARTAAIEKANELYNKI